MPKVIPAASLVALILALVVLDRAIFPFMEDQKCFWGAAWATEDKKIFTVNCLRNWASRESPLFRSHLIQPQKRKYGPRVLVMGDSFVWGDGYANVNDIWWRQLNRELWRRGFCEVEILGAGYPGFSIKSETSAARKLIEDLKPDLVIWGYAANDADEGLVPQSPDRSSHRIPGLVRRLLPNISQYVARQYFSHCSPLVGHSQQGYAKSEWELRLLQGENARRFEGTVADIGQLIREYHIPGIVVTLPEVADTAYCKERFDPVRSIFQRTGVPFVDLSQDLPNWYSQVLLYLAAGNPFLLSRPTMVLQITPANGHPGAALTYYYARKVADLLERNYLHLLGKRQLELQRCSSIAINDCTPICVGLTKTRKDFELQYPPQNFLLTMPIRKPFVQLNLSMPTTLKRICLTGPFLQQIKVYVTTIDPVLGFDTGKITALPEHSGDHGEWNLASLGVHEAVNTILVCASFSAQKSHRLSLSLDQL